jgi:hypothetical protein
VPKKIKDEDINALKLRIDTMLPTLNEYQRRRYLSAEAKALGYGGVTLVSRLSGMSRQTLTRGVKELDELDAEISDSAGSRKSGRGRKSLLESSPEILDELVDLLEADTEDDSSLLLWTNKSRRDLSESLQERGYSISTTTVSHLQKKLGYGLQADKKTFLANLSYPNRNVQYWHINAEAKKAIVNGNPVLSIDVKEKEKIDNYESYTTSIEALDHDFPISKLSKATPFGLYEIFKNKGFASVGLSLDTAVFAVESIRRWWYAEGASEYENAEKIVLIADCDDTNGNWGRLWKFEIYKLVNELNKEIQVMHFPPGPTKWNTIEPRMFSFIKKNLQGIPLVNAAIIVNLVGDTKAERGPSIRCVLDEEIHEKASKSTEIDLNSAKIIYGLFDGE